MRGRSFGHWFGIGPEAWPAAVIVGALLVAAAAALVWWVLRERRVRREAAGLSDSQRETLEDVEAQVTALIVQRGGEVDQTAIVAALDLPARLVAEKLLELERAGTIERRWSVDRMTYSVKRPAA